jgi:DNA helicase-2/ATP-dependent DNA helicase PcrA
VALESLVPRCVRLLERAPEVAAGLGCRWLCVDEYQDVNRAQYELVRQLGADGRGVCVIGDPDQAIYGFRGSDSAYFLRFAEDFPDAQVFHLNRNYRSSGTIVAAANQVMAPGRARLSDGAGSVAAAGVRIRFHQAATAAAEAEFITHEVEKWLGGTALFSVDSDRVTGHDAGDVSLGDVAILVRLHAQMKPLAEALERLGLPVQIVGHSPFVEQPGAPEILAALRSICVNPGTPAHQAVAGLGGGRTPGSLSPEAARALAACAELARAFPGTLGAFLDMLMLRSGADCYDPRAERIALMTLHAAKGLEFPVVFIAGCEDGLLPYSRPDERPDVAEERRLLYVGMTRAERVLYLTSARKRVLFGKTIQTQPSPFLAEIEAGLRDHLETAPRPARPRERQLELGL